MSRGSENAKRSMAFSGIHIIEPKLLKQFTRTGKFSIIDTYLDVAKQEIICGFDHTNSIWLDVGKPDALAKGNEVLKIIQHELK